MSNIKINNLTFRYDDSDQDIFKDLSLNLDSSWKLGLVGRNGRGKTTFLKLLLNKLHGTGEIQTNLQFSYFPLKVEDEDNITLFALQELVEVEEWKLKRELNLMKVDPDIIWQPFSTLSGGEKTKVLLALSFTDEDSFPLIDEPTNHLDEAAREQVEQYLQNHKQGYIVVSHDRSFLNQTTDHILAIENGEIHLYQGNFEQYEDTKEKRDNFNQAKNAKLKGEIGRLSASKSNFKNWSNVIEGRKHIGQKTQGEINRRTQLDKGFIGHQSEKMMRKAKNAEKRIDRDIEEKQGLMTNIEEIPDLTMNFQADYHRDLITINHLDLAISQGPKILHDLNLTVNNQGIIALEGENGAGKTSFFKYLLEQGQFEEDGEIQKVENLKISYLPQEFTIYSGHLADFAQKEQVDYEKLLNNLKKMGFPRSSFNTKIEDMSMGQQKRVALAKSLAQEANLYLWDEPANYLDVFNQDQLIKLLKEVKPAMILIEHDRYFVDQVADQKIFLKKSQKI
ncbi:ABC superfamily ATP binding cassette transporter [Lactobacillus pasteurii DSM 23907 = CRBIP 24.76]|uniref:ABC superfamily ATP binding cassette transporter n=1 Tax=Lactobacillus pasteurii DSM 23907 = CRBIP 24.76 TaxID=1423790 RepID=I7LED1_9LACO|nr:ABC-F type ribosomal protection protein [Lactobacillus pasteurii]KRK08460.1 ABC superfamily ATP binding cassette transporter [Lactobacillus pasteurii DSM 23907 = CRBIP 24.76]TDG75638.1 hypothetical protein C5L33_000523 [Lactobacillus pasteurii]CCI85683.1 ABC superfamily ATP binding cassette transporter [Lactobacillus pasteurii DSM 23907 = CRBIP 24.76]